MSDHVIEGLKEFARLLVLSFISYLLANAAGLLTQAFGTYLSPETLTILTAFITYVLKAVDKWLHDKEPAGVSGGLVRF